MNCRVCEKENINPKILKTNDKMLGNNQVFEYIECIHCNSLTIKEIPINIADFYPQNYYSFSSQKSVKEKIAFYLRDKVLYYNSPKFIVNYFKEKIPNLSLEAFLKLKLPKNAKILDVGCGEGKFLNSIYHLGYKNMMGIDPFIEKDAHSKFHIYKKNIFEIDDKFDLITFNHVLEHVDHINGVIEKCYQLLKPQGKIIIRVPFKESWAYEHYGENWVQWDAPRHFQLFSKKGLTALAENNSFKIIDFYFDSYDFQFTGSEKYKQGLSYSASKNNFDKSELKKFKEKSKELNHNQLGDQVVVVFEKEI